MLPSLSRAALRPTTSGSDPLDMFTPMRRNKPAATPQPTPSSKLASVPDSDTAAAPYLANRTPSPTRVSARRTSRRGSNAVNTFGGDFGIRSSSPPVHHLGQKFSLPHNAQGQAVQTILETAERDFSVGAAVSERHRQAWERRMGILRETMTSRLEAHLIKEGQRHSASHSKLSKDSFALVTRWNVSVVLARSVVLLREALRRRNALAVVSQFMTVRCLHFLRRFKHRQARNAQLAELLEHMPPPPTVEDLQRGTMLSKLPADFLKTLIPLFKPRCCLVNEALCIDEAPGTEVLVVMEGTINVCRRPRQGAANAGGVVPESVAPHLPAHLTGPGILLCEPVLFHTENYESKVLALTPLKCYALHVKSFHDHIAKLTQRSSASDASAGGDPAAAAAAAEADGLRKQWAQKVSEQVDRLMDSRRSQVIEAKHRMTEERVRESSPVFKSWSTSGIQQLLALCRCQIHRKGDILVPPGKYGRSIFFIVSGRLACLDSTDPQATAGVPSGKLDIYGEGQCVGALEAALRKKDTKTMVRAITNCDVWELRAQDFRYLACHETAFALLPAVIELEGVPDELRNLVKVDAAPGGPSVGVGGGEVSRVRRR